MMNYVCPVCRASLTRVSSSWRCDRCGGAYPIVRGIPILLNDMSVFQVEDYVEGDHYGGAGAYGGETDRTRGVRAAYHRFAQRLSNPTVAGKWFKVEEALAYVKERVSAPRVLVIGAGDLSYTCENAEITYTDVAFGKYVDCVCDAHDLPYESGWFDLVIACAVLEHVADPQRCVAQICTVLRPGGFVYAVTPFLQPVHMGAHDFTRFTYLGHRRLFRDFDDLQSGTFGGPASALTAVMRATLASITPRPKLQAALKLLGLLIAYPLRYLDPLLTRHESAYDCAFASMFFGKKREAPISDRELLKLYRGSR